MKGLMVLPLLAVLVGIGCVVQGSPGTKRTADLELVQLLTRLSDHNTIDGAVNEVREAGAKDENALRDSEEQLLLRQVLRILENKRQDTECHTSSIGLDYRGSVSRTILGRRCQKWTAQSPQAHSRTPENYPNSGLGDHNYCRNPDGESGPWCYTTYVGERWEYCEVEQPSASCDRSTNENPTAGRITDTECFKSTTGLDYRGLVSVTSSGRQCKNWMARGSPEFNTRPIQADPNTGIGDHNYCRNPDGESGPWCYANGVGPSWELCNVGQPSSSCDDSTK